MWTLVKEEILASNQLFKVRNNYIRTVWCLFKVIVDFEQARTVLVSFLVNNKDLYIKIFNKATPKSSPSVFIIDFGQVVVQ